MSQVRDRIFQPPSKRGSLSIPGRSEPRRSSRFHRRKSLFSTELLFPKVKRKRTEIMPHSTTKRYSRGKKGEEKMLDTDKLNLCPAVNILKKSLEISRIYARSHENRVKGKSKHIFCVPCLAPQIRFLFFSLSVSRSSPLFLGNTFFREICLTVYKGRCKQPPPRGVVPESMGMGRVSGTGMGAPLLLRQPLRMQEVRQVGSLASR